MGTDIVERTPMQTVLAQVEHPAFLEQIRQSLPENVSMERFVRVTLTAIRSEPSLITKDQNTLFASIVRCAQDGLLPDGREAAFVSFGNKVAYMPMIGGFRKIAAEHGWAIDTQVVYANDEFDFRAGADPYLDHRPAALDADPGEKIGAYAVATHEDGRKLVEVMRKQDILKVRNVSRAKESGPWVDWEERMWEKTVGRRIFGKLPLAGSALERAQSVIQANDHEYVLPAAPRMSEAEANIAAPLSGLKPPQDAGPQDKPAQVEVAAQHARLFELVVQLTEANADVDWNAAAAEFSQETFGRPSLELSEPEMAQVLAHLEAQIPPAKPKGRRAA